MQHLFLHVTVQTCKLISHFFYSLFLSPFLWSASLSLTQCSALPHSSLRLFFSSFSFFFFAFCLRRSCRRGFVVACRRGFRFCSGSNGWVSILWVCGYGFAGRGLWWLWAEVGGIRWPWVSGFGDEGFPALGMGLAMDLGCWWWRSSGVGLLAMKEFRRVWRGCAGLREKNIIKNKYFIIF